MGTSNLKVMSFTSVLCFLFHHRVTWASQWENCTGTISVRPQSLDLKPSISASKICASSNLCWRNGWVTQVQDDTVITHLLQLVQFNVFNRPLCLLENSPSECMSTSTSLPLLIEGYGRKRKKRTSIETNIKLTLEKRFMDVRQTF